jgi:hypothetical protein
MQAILITELNRVIAELATAGRVDNFYSSLSESFRKYGSLTERQEAALKRSLTNYHDRNERIVAGRKERVISSPIPTGRVTITGKVISTKWVENDFGGCTKMLVESDQGWRVYGTMPSRLSQRNDVRSGTKVAFTATVTPKEADFGFFSRPTGGAVLTEEHPLEQITGPVEPCPLAKDETIATPVIQRPVHFAPIAKDVSPEQLLPQASIKEPAMGRYTNGLPAPKLTSLAAMVAAAGYNK